MVSLFGDIIRFVGDVPEVLAADAAAARAAAPAMRKPLPPPPPPPPDPVESLCPKPAIRKPLPVTLEDDGAPPEAEEAAPLGPAALLEEALPASMVLDGFERRSRSGCCGRDRVVEEVVVGTWV